MFPDVEPSEGGPIAAKPPERQSVARARLKKLQSNFSLSIINRVVGSLRAWLVNPFLILCLGPQNFGVWTALASINTLDQMMDLGMGNSLVNAVATARGLGQEGRVAVLSSLVLRKLCLFSLVAATLLLGCSLALDTSSVLVFIHPDNLPAHWALFWILASLVLSTPLSVVEKVEAGYQKYHYIWSAQIFASFTSLCVFGLCWLQGWRPDMAMVALISLGPAFVARVLNWALFFGYLAPELRPRLSLSRPGLDDEWERVNRTGWMFFYLQCSYLVCFSLDYLIVGNLAGGSSVGVFACVSTYTAAAGILPTLLIQPLWPAYNEATAAKDFDWCRLTFRRITAVAVACALAGCLGLHFLEGVLLPRFAPGIPITQAILLAAYVSVILESIKFSLNTLLNGLDRLRFLLYTHLLFFVVATPLKVLALKSGDLGLFLWARTALAALVLVLPASWLVVQIFKYRTNDGLAGSDRTFQGKQ